MSVPIGGYIALLFSNGKIVPHVVKTMEEANRISKESLYKIRELTPQDRQNEIQEYQDLIKENQVVFKNIEGD